MSRDFADLETFILEKMRNAKTPGLSIAIVENGETVYVRGFGFGDLASGKQVTPRTLFGIGSVTKSFTALSIMQLVDEGKIRVDDPVEEYLPLKLRSLVVPVTVHHLLTHASGIPDLGYATAFLSSALGYNNTSFPVSSAEDVISFMHGANDWAVSKPGERFFYLNEGYVLLGQIIAKITGLTYQEYVRQKILTPLRMDRTFFSKVDVDHDGDIATPYIVDKEGKHLPSAHPYGLSSDGGLISNVVDLSNYVKMWLDRGEFEGEKLVNQETLGKIETPHVRLPSQVFGDDSYGYGWAIIPNFFGYKLVEHDGSVRVYTADVAYIPEKRVGVSVLANASGADASIGLYALSQLIGQDPRTLPFIKIDRILSKLEGQYETFKGTIRITVKKSEGIIYLEYRDKYREEVLPLTPEALEEDHATFYWIANGAKTTVEFRMSGNMVELIGDRQKFAKKT